VKPVELEAAQVGTRVRVRLDYGEPHLQGSVGTIQKRYGVPDYTAFDILLPDGRTKLFWEHQLEEVTEPSHRPKRRWVFW
jgi:hypothetical protein